MKISLIGLGWFGEALGKQLNHLGHDVLGTTRTPQKGDKLSALNFKTFLLNHPALPDEELFLSDLIILNIPPFHGQLEWFKLWPWRDKSHVIFISSTSVYLDDPILVNEESPTIQNKELVLEEQWILKHLKQVSILRFGGLLGDTRHPGQHLAGKKDLKNRLWPVNLLHLEDAIGFTLALIEEGLKGVFNVVGDEHSTREKFYTEYSLKHHLPIPLFDLADQSQGKIVCNTKAKTIYKFRSFEKSL